MKHNGIIRIPASRWSVDLLEDILEDNGVFIVGPNETSREIDVDRFTRRARQLVEKSLTLRKPGYPQGTYQPELVIQSRVCDGLAHICNEAEIVSLKALFVSKNWELEVSNTVETIDGEKTNIQRYVLSTRSRR